MKTLEQMIFDAVPGGLRKTEIDEIVKAVHACTSPASPDECLRPCFLTMREELRKRQICKYRMENPE